jgi:flagellar basal-body rod modification protein FlgD
MSTGAISTDVLSKVSPPPTATSAAGANADLSSKQFLTLFITQLQNQDPLSPMDPQQLTAQLAQLSSLEQLTGINTRLDKLASQTNSSTTSALIGLIGKQVTFDGSQLAEKGGKVNPVGYTLTTAADKVTASIVGSDGTVLRTVEIGAQGAGAHTFQFDGRDGNGAALADGTYKLEIAELPTGSKTPAAVALTTQAPVDGVDFSSDPPVLIVGGQRIGLDQVQEVRTPVPTS